MQCDPVSYVIEVDGAERNTEASWFAETPDPKNAQANVASETETAATAKQELRIGSLGIESSGRADSVGVAPESNFDALRSAFKKARELSTRAADVLESTKSNPGPTKTHTVAYLKQAIEVLESSSVP